MKKSELATQYCAISNVENQTAFKKEINFYNSYIRKKGKIFITT